MRKTPKNQPLKSIFIAHPVRGDEKRNLQKINEISLQIYQIPGHIPVFPNHTWSRCLGNGPEDQKLKEKTLFFYFLRCVDEVWVYGPRISEGMKKEILLALWFNIRVVIKNPKLQAEYAAIRKAHKERTP